MSERKSQQELDFERKHEEDLQRLRDVYKRQGRELMKNEIEAMIKDITATTAEAEDYTGEDGLLYCGCLLYTSIPPPFRFGSSGPEVS